MEANMSSRPLARRLLAVASTALIALIGMHGAIAQTRTSGATLVVTVLADRYVSEGAVFKDLETLASLVEPTRPTWLVLEYCDSTAPRSLLTAAERFRDSPLHIVPADAAHCVGAAPVRAVLLAQAGVVAPVRPSAGPDLRYWGQMTP
jgi:hypothetical protein